MTGAAKIFCRKYSEGRNKQLKKITKKDICRDVDMDSIVFTYSNVTMKCSCFKD